MSGKQALVQYPDPGSAANAKAALEGHAIYDGGYNRVRNASLLALCLRAEHICLNDMTSDALNS